MSTGSVSEAALVVPSFASGGAERVVLNLARGLRDAGVQVRIIALDGRGPLRDLVPDGIPVVDLRRPRARSAGSALLSQLRRAPVDLLIGSQTHLNALLALLRPLLPSATRLVLREPTLGPRLDASQRRDRALGSLLGRADIVVASSAAMRDQLARTVRGRAQVHLLPNPVDLTALRDAARDVRRDKATHARRGPELVTVGRLVAGKAHDDLLRALVNAPEVGPLTIIGDGPLRVRLEQLAETLGIAHRVAFVGSIDDPSRLASIVASADLLVHPSRFEGMPNAVLEALALGTAVLATTDLTVLDGLVGEIGPAALRIVPRDGLAAAITQTTRADGPVPRPSLLPQRFAIDAVVTTLLDAVATLPGRGGA